MNDNIEDYILGQLLYYPQAQALLPRIKPNWFEGILHKHIVEQMIEKYFNNDPIDYMSLSKGLTREQTTKYELMGCQGQKVMVSYLVHNCNTQQI